ncbi:MAG: hypothetical protein NC429_10050 [Lachnospiraceae bacterium]|nr:hypothetical protein [Lachnospiraceae bacterium]
MKVIIVAKEDAYTLLLHELSKILSANPRNVIEQHMITPGSLPRIQSSGADLVITINLSGFELTTLTGGISYNLWNAKFVHFLLKRNLKNEIILQKPLSISMFFYCVGKEYKEYLLKKYPEIPYLEELSEWEDNSDEEAVLRNAGRMAYAVYKTAGKCGLPYFLSPSQVAEFHFRQLQEELPEIKAACRHIDEVLDKALDMQDISALLTLIPYIESDKGKLAWKHMGETRRILQILSIIRLEAKYQEPLFCSGCRSKEELLEKYLVMLFALRRIAFWLSGESVDEAEQFLKSADLSPFAVHAALQNERIPSNRENYQYLSNLLRESWNAEERLLFMQMAEMAEEESGHGQ